MRRRKHGLTSITVTSRSNLSYALFLQGTDDFLEDGMHRRDTMVAEPRVDIDIGLEKFLVIPNNL